MAAVAEALAGGRAILGGELEDHALDALERAYKLAPTNNLALFLYARVQLSFQQWQESHDLFTEFDRRVPNYAPAQYALGWLDIKLNRTAEAHGHLERCVELDPAHADALYELGLLAFNDGQLDDAEKRLQAALKQQPHHAKANIAMGDLLLRKSDLAGARSRYEAAIAADPQSGPAHYRLSTVLMRLGETELGEKERALGAKLNADATKASKTVLVLADPEGRLLSGAKTKDDHE